MSIIPAEGAINYLDKTSAGELISVNHTYCVDFKCGSDGTPSVGVKLCDASKSA